MAWAYSRVASLITKHPQAALARIKEICGYLLYTCFMAMRYVKVTGNVMSWKFGRQSLTATSTPEAELLEAAKADEPMNLKAVYLVLAEMTGSSRMPSKPCFQLDNKTCFNKGTSTGCLNIAIRLELQHRYKLALPTILYLILFSSMSGRIDGA
eukprot:6491519-Amphidinium_carterae.2